MNRSNRPGQEAQKERKNNNKREKGGKCESVRESNENGLILHQQGQDRCHSDDFRRPTDRYLGYAARHRWAAACRVIVIRHAGTIAAGGGAGGKGAQTTAFTVRTMGNREKGREGV
jgi:hypothetical protein